MKVIDLIAGILVMALWGINFSVIKLGVSEIDPLLLTALRFTLVFSLLFFCEEARCELALPNKLWTYFWYWHMGNGELVD